MKFKISYLNIDNALKALPERASLNVSTKKVESVESADSDTAELDSNTSDSNCGGSQLNDGCPS